MVALYVYSFNDFYFLAPQKHTSVVLQHLAENV